jgi:tRNA A-37 threonylcarbamoyl transferase component Bud32
MPESLKDGRYSLLGLLGQGAQGQTYDAVDRREGRPVAIKRFDIRTAKTWKEAELAEREIRTLQALSHPNLPRYLDHFEEDGALYLVMDKIEGESLASLRKRGVAFSRDDVDRLFRDASEILGYLHGRTPPVIHRDLKPNNVIRRPDDSFAFVDFGAVRDKLRPEGGSTVVGTFGYMAPEQFQGRAMPASDVYAIAATALSMLTGKEPEELPHKGLAVDVRAALGPSADAGLVDSLERMLDPDPDRRAQRPSLSPPGGAPPRHRSDRGTSSGVWWQDALREGFEEQAREYERRARDYETRAYRGEAGAEHWGRGAEGWRKAADKWRAAAEKHSEKAERRAARHAMRFARKAAHHADRLAQRAGRSRRVPPWPILLLFAVAFTAGAVAVTLATQVVVPVVLRFLAVFFAREPLSRAADAVREAGDEALENIQRSQRWFMRQVREQGSEGGAPPIGAEPTASAPPDVAAHVRVGEPEPPRTRVPAPGDESADDEAGEDEARRERR